MILQFDFNDYLKNPIAQFCLRQNRQNLKQPVTVLSLEDCLPDIKKLKHSSRSLLNKRWSFIGDQLRLYYSLQYDNFLYLDSDVYIPDFTQILKQKNCTEITNSESCGKIINNGTFFHSDSSCRFNQYYFNIYEKEGIPDWMANYDLFKKYPFEYTETESGDMNLISPKVKHFLLSFFIYSSRPTEL